MYCSLRQKSNLIRWTWKLYFGLAATRQLAEVLWRQQSPCSFSFQNAWVNSRISTTISVQAQRVCSSRLNFHKFLIKSTSVLTSSPPLDTNDFLWTIKFFRRSFLCSFVFSYIDYSQSYYTAPDYTLLHLLDRFRWWRRRLVWGFLKPEVYLSWSWWLMFSKPLCSDRCRDHWPVVRRLSFVMNAINPWWTRFVQHALDSLSIAQVPVQFSLAAGMDS
jgi:hypothetical protein